MTVHLPKHLRIRILNSDDVFRIMHEILMHEEKIDQDKEHFWVMGLNGINTILFIELISLGSVREVIADPMEVFSVALQKRAVRIILIHNHPSGLLRASETDKDTTDRLIQVGLIVNTPVLDHHIITPDGYVSFEDTGLMHELRQSKKWVPPYKEVERIKAEAMRIGKELGRKEGEAKGRKEGLIEGERKGMRKGLIEGKTEGLIEGEMKGIKKGLKEGEALGVEKGLKEGKAEGLKEGKSEGRKERSIELARALLADDKYSIKQIALLTGLSEDVVKGLGEG